MKIVYWVLGLTTLFIILYHYKVFADMLKATSTSIAGTINVLQH